MDLLNKIEDFLVQTWGFCNQNSKARFYVSWARPTHLIPWKKVNDNFLRSRVWSMYCWPTASIRHGASEFAVDNWLFTNTDYFSNEP